MGLIVPLVSACVYRTYSLSLSPNWLEITRQLGAPYVFGEIGVILYAGRRGFDVTRVMRRLDAPSRWAIAIFLGTFWISSVAVASLASFSSALCLICLIHLYTGAAVFHLAGRGGFAPRDLASGFALGLAALTGIVVLHLSMVPADGPPASYGAPIPGFVSVRLFGAWAGAILALLLGLAWAEVHDRAPSRWLYPGIALATAVVTWTGTRAALFGLVVALVVVATMTRGVAARGFWRRALGAMTVGVLVAVVTPLSNGAGTLLRTGGLQSADTFSSGRLELWSKALAVAAHRPWLGHGMGSSWWLISVNGFYHVQPHNALVQFFLDWGLIPTVAALFLLSRATWQAHRLARRHPSLLALIMMLDFLLAVSLFDGMLHFAQFVMLVAIVIGACLAHGGQDAAPAT